MATITITVPDELAANDTPKLEALAREALVVRLYDLGTLSSGEGAELLSISRLEFLDLAGRYGVSIFNEGADIRREATYGD